MRDPTLAAQAQGAAMRKLSCCTRRPVGRADLSLAGLLCGHPVFVPPPGIARVHRLADDESRLPDRPDRLGQCLAAIHAGASSVGAIIKALPFETTMASFNDDLDELARCGAIRVVTGKASTRYLPGTAEVTE